MAIRNCAEIGANLQLIVNRLTANQNLLKLLYYTDQNPLSQPDITSTQIQNEIFEKLIKIVPKVGTLEDAKSLIVMRVTSGTTDLTNNEFRNVLIAFEVYVPMTQWFIVGDNLRPFMILGEIQKSLDGKKINGLGRLSSTGFELSYLTEEVSDYIAIYNLVTYD